MANKTVSFQLPAELVESIEAQAKETGQSKTDVVITALATFYGCSISLPQSTTPDHLQAQLNDFEYQLAILLAANKLYKLITSSDSPIKPGPEVDAVISCAAAIFGSWRRPITFDR